MGLFDKLMGGGGVDARTPEFSGMLYPDDEQRLRDTVSRLLRASDLPDPSGQPRAIIAPQGDYDVFGATMAAAYDGLVDHPCSRVVVVGSSRLVPFRGMATDIWEGYETPLGTVRYADVIDTLEQVEAPVRGIEAAFDPEASVEVQLPFIQVLFDEVTVCPLLVGDASVDDVRNVLEALVDLEETLVVISANLSHDVEPDDATRLDEETERAILECDPPAISRDHTNARVAIRGLLRLAEQMNWSAAVRRRTHSPPDDAGHVQGMGAFWMAS